MKSAHALPAPKADALPGCATPRPAEALRFPAIAAQAISAIRGKDRQNRSATVSTSPGIVPNLVHGLTRHPCLRLILIAFMVLFVVGPITSLVLWLAWKRSV